MDSKKTKTDKKEPKSQRLSDMVQDDFLAQALFYGIKIKEEEKQPQGKGGEYIPRLSAPAYNDKNWIHYTAKGYNYCIRIDGNECIPNCVGYAWGRWRELLGKYHKLSRMDAERWWGTNDGYERGQKPKVGAVACWRRGDPATDADGMGHVAIVEKINSDGSITCSNSAYLGTRFYLSIHKAPYSFGLYTFQGFIYIPATFDPQPSTKLDEDGVFGEMSVAAAQRWLGTEADGIISGQLKLMSKYFPSVVSVEFGGDGSLFVRALQKILGVEIDGYLGPITIKSLQRMLNKQGYDLDVDGYWGPDTSKAFQNYLNKIN